ncbi:MAG: ATP-binding protein, partial [Solirubrobacteraceae bacterium]
KVTLADNNLGGVASVRVIDNGHGMRHEDALEEFGHLGGSWKLHTSHSKNHKRLLHGKHGQGRWRAFSIGSLVRWIAVVDSEHGREQTTIVGRRAKMTQFEVGEAKPTSDAVGMTVIIENIEEDPASALLANDAADKLTAMLAPYLARCSGLYDLIRLNWRPAKPGRRRSVNRLMRADSN